MGDRKILTLVPYGPNGSGKTTSVAQAVPNSLWVVTNKNNLSGYDSWLAKHPEDAASMNLGPIPDTHLFELVDRKIDTTTGEMITQPTKATLDSVIRSYCLRVAKDEAPWDGLVLDEFSVFAQRVYDELRNEIRNGFEVISVFKQWITNIMSIPTVTRRPLVLVCHANDPKYHEDDGPKKGKLKYKGGPAMPVGTAIAIVCAMADAVLRLEITEDYDGSIKRGFKTDAHPTWESKIRLWGIDPQITLDLRSVLQEAGWEY